MISTFSTVNFSAQTHISQKHPVVYALFLLPVFLTIESTRGALYASDNASTSGPLRFLVLVLNILAFGPLRMILSWVVMIVWLPARALLWFMGIGRGEPKKGARFLFLFFRSASMRMADLCAV